MSSERKVYRLDELCEFINGFAFKSSDYVEQSDRTWEVLRMGYIHRGGGFKEDSTPVFVQRAYGKELGKYLIRPNDIVIAMTDMKNNVAILGNTARIRDANRFVLNQRVGCIRVKRHDLVDPSYLYYYSNWQPHVDYLRARANSGVQVNLSTPAIRDSEIELPPLAEQVSIGNLLAGLDDRITILRETNATLETIAQALFKSWFVDFDPVRAKMAGRAPEGMDEATAALFPDALEETELGHVPKGWRVMPFLDACDMQGGAQPPASTFIDEPRNGYIRLLQIRDFSTDAHKTYVPIEKKLKTATEDDVLIGRYGSASGDKAKDSLGRICRGLAGAYNVALMKLAPREVGREFALQLVDDPRFYQYLRGVSSKAVQSGFSKSELGQYKVVVPPKVLCDAFEDLGLAFWSRLKHGVSRQRELAELRDTLLPRLISGQLRLPEAQAQLEDALA